MERRAIERERERVTKRESERKEGGVERVVALCVTGYEVFDNS